VDGSMMAGSNIPGDIVRMVAPDVVVGNITDTPIKRSGMDFAYIFIDTDFNQSTGSAVIGSEACIVVAGKQGRVLTSTAYLYEDGIWSAVGRADAAADSKRLEVGCSYEILGLSPDGVYAVTFLSQDWQGCEDQKFAFLSTRSTIGVKAIDGIIINEIYNTHPNSSGDWIELLNTSSEPIDLSGWTLVVDGVPIYTIPDDTWLDPWEFLTLGYDDGIDLSFGKATTYEIFDDPDALPVDSVLLPLWISKSYGLIGSTFDEWDTMPATPGDWNVGQVPIPEFEGVLVPLAIVTIMFFAIRRKRSARTKEENREGETDDGHE
ncbi:MAG TPA: lamin tail domain-containing protein, partial [Thermoplasmata archaeon]|nr:lamin tail domain-containing protein [Thermoplasmata archaeon]